MSETSTAAVPLQVSDRAWKALEAHQKDIAGTHMRDLFARQVGQGKGPMQVQQPAEAAV